MFNKENPYAPVVPPPPCPDINKEFKRVDVGYGITEIAGKSATGEWGVPSDAKEYERKRWERDKLAVKILDLLTAEEGLTTKDALDIISTVRSRVDDCQNEISQRAPLRSIFAKSAHTENGHQ